MFTRLFSRGSRSALLCGITILPLLSGHLSCAQEIQKAGAFEEATMSFDGEKLTVSTGKITRQWQLTSAGLVTVGLQHGSVEYCGDTSRGKRDCDWALGSLRNAQLVSLTATEDDDERFTSRHLCVAATFLYPEQKARLRYLIWAFPGASGMRTQIQLRGERGYQGSGDPFQPQVVESLEPSLSGASRRAFGLMQGIKTNMNVSILREEEISTPTAEIGWANGLILQGQDRGMILVKESNKHTALQKKDDLATGGFTLDDGRVAVTGAGMTTGDLNSREYLSGWATWLVLYDGDQWQGNLALKQFGRIRYPIDPERDIYIMANTWGTEDMRPPCLHAAREENVLRELDSVADLGIDVLQIDDGWQTPKWTTAKSAREVQHGGGAVKDFGDYAVYPKGWTRVRKKAEQLGVTLGLWAAWTAPGNALQRNYDQGDFKYFKLDFARLNTKQKFDGLATKARELIKHSDYTSRVNWDVTEIAPRMGYFAGREYGNVYLANRKTKTVRDPVLYVPHKVLHEAWNLSKYVNLNKFQVTVQNVDNVPREAKTDAAKHSHDYAVGVALMSSPIFFQETRHYQGNARRQIREILAVYKQHRLKMYEGYVFPIGAEPDNHSWTGFQNFNPKSGKGYLTIFRERLNETTTGAFRLHFVRDTKVRFTNLLTDESWLASVDQQGEVSFELREAPGFMFLAYEELDSQGSESVTDSSSTTLR